MGVVIERMSGVLMHLVAGTLLGALVVLIALYNV